MKQWLSKDTPSAIHCLPEDDLIVHLENEDCTCCPRTTLIGYTCWDHGRPRLAVRKQIVHDAMDGRE